MTDQSFVRRSDLATGPPPSNLPPDDSPPSDLVPACILDNFCNARRDACSGREEHCRLVAVPPSSVVPPKQSGGMPLRCHHGNVSDSIPSLQCRPSRPEPEPEPDLVSTTPIGQCRFDLAASIDVHDLCRGEFV